MMVTRAGLTGPCPPFPAGAVELVRSVSRQDGWPLPADVSASGAREWLWDRPVVECVASRRFGRLVGLASLYEVPDDDASAAVWLAASGLPRKRLLAVGVLLVDPSVRSRGVGEDIVVCALTRVRSLGRFPVAATHLDVAPSVLVRLGLRDVGAVQDSSGAPVRVLVGV